MDSDVSTDQGNFPVHGIRDVRRKADTEQHDWSEQAEAPETNTLLAGRKSYRNMVLIFPPHGAVYCSRGKMF